MRWKFSHLGTFKLFKVPKIGAKLILFSLKYRLPVSTIRGADGATYLRGFFQKVFRRGRGCLHILSFFLSFCLLRKGRSKRKHKRFDIKAYYRNKTKTFWFGPLIIGTKAERFNLFQNYLKSNWNVLAFFKVQKRNQNETELISYRIETFPYNYASKETNGTFVNYFQIFLLVRNVFVCFKLLRNQNRTFVF